MSETYTIEEKGHRRCVAHMFVLRTHLTNTCIEIIEIDCGSALPDDTLGNDRNAILRTDMSNQPLRELNGANVITEFKPTNPLKTLVVINDSDDESVSYEFQHAPPADDCDFNDCGSSYLPMDKRIDCRYDFPDVYFDLTQDSRSSSKGFEKPIAFSSELTNDILDMNIDDDVNMKVDRAYETIRNAASKRMSAASLFKLVTEIDCCTSDISAPNPPPIKVFEDHLHGINEFSASHKKTTAPSHPQTALIDTTNLQRKKNQRKKHDDTGSFASMIQKNNSAGRNFANESEAEGRVSEESIKKSLSKEQCAQKLGDEYLWQVFMLIDIREKDHNLIESKLISMGIPCVVTRLALGDYLWAARPMKATAKSGGQESIDSYFNTAADNLNLRHAYSENKDDWIVLDCIAERKTVADLASSIVDGRYLEQKIRLRDCGLNHRIYLVEGTNLNCPIQQTAINSSTIRAAMASTQVQFGITVWRTRSIDHTILLLAAVYNFLEISFRQGICRGFSPHDSREGSETNLSNSETATLPNSYAVDFAYFSYFQIYSSKKQVTTVGELFLRQLRQIPGVSVITASILQESFKTMVNFMQWLKSRHPYEAQVK
jgi:ERCC4-type nuclease